jgi:hypothetical protein
MQTEVKMNDRKIEILTHMSDYDWWTSTEIALWCGLSLTNASELLRRYRGQGLLNRVRNYDVPRGYKYRITNVGLERLQYLYSPTMKTSSTIASRAGVSGSDRRVLDRWIKQKLGR